MDDLRIPINVFKGHKDGVVKNVAHSKDLVWLHKHVEEPSRDHVGEGERLIVMTHLPRMTQCGII